MKLASARGLTPLEMPLAAAVVVLLALLIGTRADASPQSRALTQQGFALAYDLRFEAACAAFARAIEADAADPAPHRALAAVTWMEILFAQGVATFEAFAGEIPESDVARPTPPAALVTRFQRSMAEATRLSDAQLSRRDDADGHYQVGATAALLTVYRATVEGRTVGALTQGRRAVAAMKRARARDPGMRETALLLAMSEYTVSTLSWPARALARLSGLTGDRRRALALITEAASPGAATETDALLLLMIMDARHGRFADAVRRIQQLEGAFPHNRLLWLNHGAAALAAHRAQEAEDVLSRGISGRLWEMAPAVMGEQALWLAHRGTARARLDRRQDARLDLQAGLDAAPRDWVAGRIHYQLGELAVSNGEHERARREFETALVFSQRGSDQVTVRRVRRRLGRDAR